MVASGSRCQNKSTKSKNHIQWAEVLRSWLQWNSFSRCEEAVTESLIPATRKLGFSDTFSGIVLLGGVGGIGEVLTAVRFARKGKQELVMAATVGSTIQMVLFVAPLLVFTGLFLGESMNLSFSMFEVVSIVLAIIIAKEIINAGKATWIEGLVLLATYLVLAIGFYTFRCCLARDQTAAEGIGPPYTKLSNPGSNWMKALERSQ